MVTQIQLVLKLAYTGICYRKKAGVLKFDPTIGFPIY